MARHRRSRPAKLPQMRSTMILVDVSLCALTFLIPYSAEVFLAVFVVSYDNKRVQRGSWDSKYERRGYSITGIEIE